MALKRINKELADLGRYVNKKFPLAHLPSRAIPHERHSGATFSGGAAVGGVYAVATVSAAEPRVVLADPANAKDAL